jgi:hypothetical protein
MKPVHVFVTDDDIERAIPECSDSCPIALACQRAGLDEASFDLSDLAFLVGERDLSVYLGDACQKFARDFDARLPVAPFDFIIEAPEVSDLDFSDEEGDEEP